MYSAVNTAGTQIYSSTSLKDIFFRMIPSAMNVFYRRAEDMKNGLFLKLVGMHVHTAFNVC